MIKTFRGILDSGETETIRLHTTDGMTGYRIKKFQLIQEKPGAQDTESVVMVCKRSFTPTTDINLDDQNIIAVGFYGGGQIASAYPIQEVIIFENEIVNQDIFIGTQDHQSKKMNYYLELEQVKLDLNEATVATLKDMRGRE